MRMLNNSAVNLKFFMNNDLKRAQVYIIGNGLRLKNTMFREQKRKIYIESIRF